MLNSFWNLCRICPSMPTEKFNSEYKTHFKWHDSSYHAPIQEAIKRQTDQTLVTATQELLCEPALSRKKKYPEMAYRTNQVLRMVKGEVDSLEMLALANRESRARSEERDKNRRGSIRSRSVEPYLGRRHYTAVMTQSYPPAGYGPMMPKMSEYRSQFAWPPGGLDTPRKSISMGAIQPQPPHRTAEPKSPVNDEVAALEEQIVVDGIMEQDLVAAPVKKFRTEYKARFKAPAKYTCVDGSWMKSKDGQKLESTAPTAVDELAASWIEELLELRKKADEYKVRAWGTTLEPLTKQDDVWKEVAQRSSLSALALAATPREGKKGKAEKEKENLAEAQQRKRFLARPRPKSAAVTAMATTAADQPPRKPRPPSHIIPRGEPSRTSTRHHLERTTPASDGSLLTSPTRDHKLEPTALPSTRSEKSKTTAAAEIRSPKHISRAQTAAPSQRTVVDGETAKRQRPTSLSNVGSKSKSVPPTKSRTSESLAKTHTTGRPKTGIKGTKEKETQEKEEKEEKDKETTPLLNGQHEEEPEVTSPPEMSMKSPEMVPMVKSPPEPTRVKSPEQISAKSPEPVKWTIPLDTGIKWTDNLIIDGDGSYKDEFKKSPLPTTEAEASESQLPATTERPAVCSTPTGATGEEPRSLGGAPPPLTSPGRGTLAIDVLDKARTRFDQFWGKSKDEK